MNTLGNTTSIFHIAATIGREYKIKEGDRGSKINIYRLEKELNIESNEIINELSLLKFNLKSRSDITKEQKQSIKQLYCVKFGVPSYLLNSTSSLTVKLNDFDVTFDIRQKPGLSREIRPESVADTKSPSKKSSGKHVTFTGLPDIEEEKKVYEVEKYVMNAAKEEGTEKEESVEKNGADSEKAERVKKRRAESSKSSSRKNKPGLSFPRIADPKSKFRPSFEMIAEESEETVVKGEEDKRKRTKSRLPAISEEKEMRGTERNSQNW